MDLNKMELAMKTILRRYFHHILFLSIAFLFVGRSLDFHLFSHFFNGGDTAQWLNFNLFIEKGFKIWWSSESGFVPPMAFWTVPYNLVLKILYLATNHLILTINIFWIILIYFVQLSFFLFYNIFIEKWKSIIAVFLTIFNIYFLTLFQTPVAFSLVGFLAFPLLYFLFHSYVIKRRFYYAFFYIIFQLILFRSLNILIISNLFVPVLFYFLNSKRAELNFRLFFKKLMTVWTLSAVMVSFFLINMLVYSPQKENSFTEDYNNAALAAQRLYKLSNVYRFTLNNGFFSSKGEKRGLAGKDFSVNFLENPVWISISFLLFILFFFSIFNSSRSSGKNKRVSLILLFLIVILLFLVKGVNSPFENVAKYLYSNYIFTILFRNSAKYFTFFTLPLIIVYLLKFLRLNTFTKVIITIVIAAHFSLFLIFHKPIHQCWDYQFPKEYTEINQELQKIKDSDKIIILPISSSFVGYTAYDDGYTGPEILYTLSDKDFMIKIHSVVMPEKYTETLNRIRKDPGLVNNFYKVLGYRYVLVEKNTISLKGYIVEDYSKIVDSLDSSLWQKKFENEKFILYSLKDGYFPGKIFGQNADVVFKRIDDTKYLINLKLKNTTNLNFLEAFHTGWKIYPTRNSKKMLCNQIGQVSNSSSYECFSNSNFFEGGELNYLLEKPILDSTHKTTLNYANGWTIDSEYIKRNFSKEYYTENPDGSIDINLVLYFKPQSYYYLGLLVSALTLVGLFGYLGYDFFKRKKENETKNKPLI